MLLRFSWPGCSGGSQAFLEPALPDTGGLSSSSGQRGPQQLSHQGAPAQASCIRICIRTRSPGDLGHIKVGECSDVPQNYHIQVPPACRPLDSSLPFQALYPITDGFSEGLQVLSTPSAPPFITDVVRA